MSSDQIFEVVKDSAFAVFPSLVYEVSPLTIVELQKMAYIPVVVAQDCAGSELIEVGVTGEIYDQTNVSSLVHTMNLMTFNHVRELKMNIFNGLKSKDINSIESFGADMIDSLEEACILSE